MKKHRHILKPLALCAASLLFAAPVYAGTDDDTMDVTATVLATCDVIAQDLSFGNYDPIAASNVDAATTVSLTCTNGTPYHLGISLGAGTGASMATRYMKQGANQLGYTLYQNGARTTLWGTATGDSLAGSGTGSAATINVYGRIPMQQAVPAGSYSDTITVTVTW
ncbi:MAG: spore coat U domain-containing protein [Caulobacterales bacterium]